MWTDLPLLLAQEEAPPPQIDAPAASETGEQTGADGTPLGGDPNATGGRGAFDPTLLILLGVMVLFIFLMGGGRREKKRRAAMIAALGKGDRVQTIGGIRGTVLDIKDDEVTLKVDENANTRMRFATSAVQSVLESKKNGE